jgi:hypothetical protein
MPRLRGLAHTVSTRRAHQQFVHHTCEPGRVAATRPGAACDSITIASWPAPVPEAPTATRWQCFHTSLTLPNLVSTRGHYTLVVRSGQPGAPHSELEGCAFETRQVSKTYWVWAASCRCHRKYTTRHLPMSSGSPRRIDDRSFGGGHHLAVAHRVVKVPGTCSKCPAPLHWRAGKIDP